MGDRSPAASQILACAIAFAVPVLLALPFVLIVQRQVAGLRAAEALLGDEIARVEPALGELADMNRVRAEYLARKQVAAVLGRDRLRVVQVLNAIGALPADIRLRALAVADDGVVLTGAGADATAPTRAVAALHGAGLQDVVPTPVPEAASASFAVRARVPAAAEPAP